MSFATLPVVNFLSFSINRHCCNKLHKKKARRIEHFLPFDIPSIHDLVCGLHGTKSTACTVDTVVEKGYCVYKRKGEIAIHDLACVLQGAKSTTRTVDTVVVKGYCVYQRKEKIALSILGLSTGKNVHERFSQHAQFNLHKEALLKIEHMKHDSVHKLLCTQAISDQKLHQTMLFNQLSS